MRIGVPKERADGERRVALIPEAVRKLTAAEGVDVVVEPGAGESARIADSEYVEAGATLAASAEEALGADVVVKVAPPTAEEIGKLKQGSIVIGFLSPLTATDTVKALAAAGATSFAMESIPRTTRAQAMDALSSQSNVAGYRAGLIAAEELDRFFPMLTTAAGTVRPAKVLVLGAGVAGLQAIATVKRLGAIVTGYDVRAAVKEQVESLGASFLELDVGEDAEVEGGYAKELTAEQKQLQQQQLEDAIALSDVVITTALIPGRPAPKLITATAVQRMRDGAVIVDLAAEAGGNCELTAPGETVVREGVTIAGPLNLPSTLSEHSSQLYSRNVQALLELIVPEGSVVLDFEDEIIAGSCITRDGEIVNERAREAATAAGA